MTDDRHVAGIAVCFVFNKESGWWSSRGVVVVYKIVSDGRVKYYCFCSYLSDFSN